MAEFMSILRRLLPLLITVMAVAGCSKPAEEERVIHIATASMVKTLDPALAEDLASRNMAGALYDTLLEYDYIKRPYTLKPSMLTAMPERLMNAPDEHFPPLGGAQEIINWATGPKTVSSIARLYGKKDVMSEISAHMEGGAISNERRI